MGSGPSLALTVCPLTGVPYVDPVKAPDGFTYSRRAIEAWIATSKAANENQNTVLSPVTREPMDVSDTRALVKDEDARNAVLQAFSGSMFLGKSPQAAVARTLEGTINSVYDLNRCFAVVDSLRDLLVRVLDRWEPPKLVVIGEESAGKSTLLERLLMMSLFPRAEGVCTRSRIHVRLRHTVSSSIPQLSVIDAKTHQTTGGPWLIAAENGHVNVQEEMRRLVEQEGGINDARVAQKHIIVLHIEGPHLPSIDLIDLPGLVQAPFKAAEATRKLVAAQIEEYRKDSLFLAVLQAGRRPTSSTAIRVIEDFQLQSSTLGVFTHCDELHPAKKQQLRNWLTKPDVYGYNDCHYPLTPYGWVATSNPPAEKKNIPAAAADKLLRGKEQMSHGNLLRLQKQAQRELEIFHAEGFGDLIDEHLVGAGALQVQLHGMFSKYMLKRWAPLTLFRLGREREKLLYRLAGLGWLPNGFRRNLLAEMREKAVAAASDVLRKETDIISHAMAQQVYLPLRERVMSLLQSESNWLIEDLYDELAMKNSQLRDICRDAADKIAPCFVGCVRTAMMRDLDLPIWPSVEAEEITNNPPFVLSRFPQFIDLIVARANELLNPWRKLLVDQVDACVDRVLADASPFYIVKVRLRARPPSCRVKFSAQDIIAALLSTFMQYSATPLCEQIIVGLDGLANRIDEWSEPQREKRSRIQQSIIDIDRATSDLRQLLGGQDVVPEDLAELENISLARCTCSGVGMSHAWINLPAKFTIRTKDHNGNAIELPPGHDYDAAICTTDSDSEHQIVMKVDLVHHADGVYSGEYKMTKEAASDKNADIPHLRPLTFLRIELHGNPISGTPFPLSIAQEPRWTSALMIEKLSMGNGLADGMSPRKETMGFPLGLAVDADEIYVADMDHQQIHIFGSKDHKTPGKFLRCLVHEDGIAESKLQQPWGLAVDKSDVFVADCASCCVKMFSKDDGSFLQMFGSVGSGLGELNAPRGLTLDGDDVYIADSGNHRIQIFRKKGPGCFVPLSTFGTEGAKDGCLQNPCCMTIAGDHVHVVDKGNRRVQVFDKKDGAFIRNYGHTHLDNPIGIAVGGSYIYVADSTGNYVCVFDKADGTFIRGIGSRGTSNGQFKEPGYIVVNGQDFYVSEKGNHRVQVFH